ncbi:MAG: hypothetical protein CMM93_05325, partial [Rickettsiales bacterium]|nr:hypothetical protein [Rickettsiales bacterium]
GSVAELETQIEIALELEYWDKAVAHGLLEQADHITKMLGKMSHSLKQKTSNPESQIANPNHG